MSLAAWNSALRASASSYIERNLKTSQGSPPLPARSWRKNTPPRLELDRIAVAANSGERTSRAPPATTASRARLARGKARGAHQARSADREQRQPADLVERAGAVEELEQARDDVDRHAAVAAGADRAQQLLVRRTREGDDHAVDLVHPEDVLEVLETAELGELERAAIVHLVVDEAERDEAELGRRLQPSMSWPATIPEPTIRHRCCSGSFLCT